MLLACASALVTFASSVISPVAGASSPLRRRRGRAGAGSSTACGWRICVVNKTRSMERARQSHMLDGARTANHNRHVERGRQSLMIGGFDQTCERQSHTSDATLVKRSEGHRVYATYSEEMEPSTHSPGFNSCSALSG
eukprot:4460394-Pleurochrysis_carterae.AAC.1